MAPVKKPRPILQPHFMAQWREYRGLTQEEAADRIGVSRTLLSKIEAAKSPWGQPILQKAADVYGCQTWDLLNINPLEDPDVADIAVTFKKATPAAREAILGYAHGRLDRD